MLGKINLPFFGGKKPTEPPVTEPSGTKSSSSSGGAKSALTVNEFVARTKRSREKGLEPTRPEKVAYARYLGIDPIADADLMWIADEALNAPLPSEWTEHHDSADRVFYYNVQTHASSWTHPLEQLHRDTYKAIVSFRSGELSKKEQDAELAQMQRRCEASEREAHQELQAWSEHTDESGQKFYYNREHQRSVWTDPRPARCHELYLQMKALRVLSKQAGQVSGMPFGKTGIDIEDIDKKKLQDALSRKKDPFGGEQPATEGADYAGFHGNSTDEDGGEGRKRKKKKRRDEEGRSRKHASESPFSSPREERPVQREERPGQLEERPRLGQLQSLPQGQDPFAAFNKPKPVEEIRAELGLGGGSGLPQMRQQRNNSLLGDRLPDPAGDGLNMQGHTKVRAGIRLTPLQ